MQQFTLYGHDFIEDEQGHAHILLDQAEAYAMRQVHAGRISVVGHCYAYSTDAVSDAAELAAVTDRTLAELTVR